MEHYISFYALLVYQTALPCTMYRLPLHENVFRSNLMKSDQSSYYRQSPLRYLPYRNKTLNIITMEQNK